MANERQWTSGALWRLHGHSSELKLASVSGTLGPCNSAQTAEHLTQAVNGSPKRRIDGDSRVDVSTLGGVSPSHRAANGSSAVSALKQEHRRSECHARRSSRPTEKKVILPADGPARDECMPFETNAVELFRARDVQVVRDCGAPIQEQVPPRPATTGMEPDVLRDLLQRRTFCALRPVKSVSFQVRAVELWRSNSPARSEGGLCAYPTWMQTLSDRIAPRRSASSISISAYAVPCGNTIVVAPASHGMVFAKSSPNEAAGGVVARLHDQIVELT
jgi:hypothetical protein